MTTKPSKIYEKKFSFANIKKKFNLKIIYSNKLIKKKKISIKNMDNLKNYLKRSNINYVIVVSNYVNEKKLILREFKNLSDIKLADYYLNTNCFEQNTKSLLRILKLNLTHISNKNFFFTTYIFIKIFWIIYKNLNTKKISDFKIDYFFYACLLDKNQNLFNKTVHNCKVPSFDLLKCYNLKKVLLPKKKYILFQDEMLIDHQDLKLLKEKIPEDLSYHQRLNTFFDYLEKKFGYEVIISLHPRANLKNSLKLFKGRKCKLYKTAELVKESEFICMHASTSSVSFPVFFKKKILLLSSNNILKNFNYRFRLEILSDMLNLNVLNIDDKKNFEIRINQFLKKKINIKKYVNFKKSFLGPEVKVYKDFSDICGDYLI